jgi:uncharacterized surface protein with fasciclin (FAS1) repeats
VTEVATGGLTVIFANGHSAERTFMSIRTRWICAPLCLVALLAGCSMMSHDDSGASMDKKDIIDTATGPGMTDVTTLVTAIKAADLVEPLKGPGPFTVFAPTNEAFAKLPPGTVEDLLKPENKEKLRSILLYHVHEGDAIMAKDVKTMNLSTMNGKSLSVTLNPDGTVMINNAKVIKADIVCSNGVIHWIDTVLMP